VTEAPELDAEQIIDAAVAIFRESGLDAVSMRSVSSRLGVSPIPLYSRIGNKDALIEAIADRLLLGVAPEPRRGEPWAAYARRWAQELLARLRTTRDSRLILRPGREAYVDASRPLIDVMRNAGFAPDASVQACRLIIWATVGFAAVEVGATPSKRGARRGRPGGDPTGVDAADIDALFEIHVGYVVDGIARDRRRHPG
jgi:TetR/AcrR family tetracycline transcriptional repressor